MKNTFSELIESTRQMKSVQDAKELMDILAGGEITVYCVKNEGAFLNLCGYSVDSEAEISYINRKSPTSFAIFSKKEYADKFADKYGGSPVEIILKDLYEQMQEETSIIIDYDGNDWSEKYIFAQFEWYRVQKEQKLHGFKINSDSSLSNRIHSTTETDILYTKSLDNVTVPQIGQTVAFYRIGDCESSRGLVVGVEKDFVEIRLWDGERFIDNEIGFFESSIELEEITTTHTFISLDSCKIVSE